MGVPLRGPYGVPMGSQCDPMGSLWGPGVTLWGPYGVPMGVPMGTLWGPGVTLWVPIWGPYLGSLYGVRVELLWGRYRVPQGLTPCKAPT